MVQRPNRAHRSRWWYAVRSKRLSLLGQISALFSAVMAVGCGVVELDGQQQVLPGILDPDRAILLVEGDARVGEPLTIWVHTTGWCQGDYFISGPHETRLAVQGMEVEIAGSPPSPGERHQPLLPALNPLPTLTPASLGRLNRLFLGGAAESVIRKPSARSMNDWGSYRTPIRQGLSPATGRLKDWDSHRTSIRQAPRSEGPNDVLGTWAPTGSLMTSTDVEGAVTDFAGRAAWDRLAPEACPCWAFGRGGGDLTGLVVDLDDHALATIPGRNLGTRASAKAPLIVRPLLELHVVRHAALEGDPLVPGPTG
jgi:hypothetical protein